MKPASLTLAALLRLGFCLSPGLAGDQTAPELPQFGGTLNVGTVYLTLSALSWDPADWTWKGNHDTGMVREQLFAGNLDNSVRKGGPYSFLAEAYLPADSMRGELAESWYWEDPITLVIKLREGIMFAERPGMMKAREFVAEDVVYSYKIMNESPKRIPTYFDHIKEVVARDPHTVVFYFNYYHSEWPYRYGYG
ncbi:MAG: ABC transporter substrate-binding protein, partial [Opitutae bacterium]|nr:ABC transporter substrate-binding protein [Opitutae bacterium]